MTMLATQYDQNNDAVLADFQLAMSPEVKRLWEEIHASAFRSNAATEAAFEEIKRLTEKKRGYLSQAGALERDMQQVGNVTAKTRKDLASLKASASLTDQKIAKLREQMRSPTACLYSIDLLERLAVRCNQQRHRIATEKYNAARKVESKDAQGRIDSTVSDFLPSLIVAARDVEIPGNLDKCIVLRGKIEDKRRALLTERRQLELAPLPFDDTRARVMASLAQHARPPSVAPAFRLTTTLDGRRVPGEVQWPTTLRIGTNETFDLDPIAILFAACQPQIEKMLDDLLKRAAPKDGGMSIEERNARIAEIDAKLCADDYLESALTWRCLDAGHNKVTFRHDLRPEAVLLADISFGEPSLGNG